MSPTKRLDKLEAVVVKHLEESGEIRSDLKWLRKAVIGMYAVGGTAVITALAEALWR